ncbi:phenylalanyl-tRNA synthetase, alpha subunit [Desulfarculus baarsii DSM 2075]|uniref:Phenylalanine--tRNA ligase alpha subunit n=1 Tax=Desulfarculus baarsii (strain ATCC 33931 / DSM 2075 / LMG 7858 / VKM B-1802 / 2st14) TaxID=644282 RepID=E1QF66_DESB2|nr:phenylalanine--tRNA ligase subunit alpha [Desulfarculus baarsii]ADK84202.1 phenylalanyl-tRNA synthetase, alpha subunit [Desulfarculus baarsii DSM 2075]
MFDELKALGAEAVRAIAQAADAAALEALRTSLMGRKGSLTQALRKTGGLPPELRPQFGALVNQVKAQVEAALDEAKDRLGQGAAASGGALDLSLPGARQRRGRLHPVSQTERLILEVFGRMGFDVRESPEVETDWYCFEALNMPPDHPARDMQDTFYVDRGVVLRTHTSPVQIHVMETTPPPVRVVAPGKTYRRDSDATHTPMFHQVEGLLVDKGVSLAHLKGVLTEFLHQIFDADAPVRFRPSFFPFTEPSAEVDIGCVVCGGKGCRVCSHTGWLEIMGCGMVDPNVFRNVGYDPDEVSGFAFGMGVERIAMLRLGIDDLRMFYENDLRFLRQF